MAVRLDWAGFGSGLGSEVGVAGGSSWFSEYRGGFLVWRRERERWAERAQRIKNRRGGNGKGE